DLENIAPGGLNLNLSGTTTMSSACACASRDSRYSAAELSDFISLSMIFAPHPPGGVTLSAIAPALFEPSNTNVMPRLSGIGSSGGASPMLLSVGVLFITPPSMKVTVQPGSSSMSTGLNAPGNDADACTATETGRSGWVSAPKTYSWPRVFLSVESSTFSVV